MLILDEASDAHVIRPSCYAGRGEGLGQPADADERTRPGSANPARGHTSTFVVDAAATAGLAYRPWAAGWLELTTPASFFDHL